MQLEHTDLNSWKVFLVPFFFLTSHKSSQGLYSWFKLVNIPSPWLALSDSTAGASWLRKSYVTFLHYSWQTMHWRLILLKTHTQQTYQRAMLFQFFDCNCPTVITMLWIIKNNNTCIVSKRTIIFLKWLLNLSYLSWKEYVETVFFHAVCQDNTLHWVGANMSTRSEWIDCSCLWQVTTNTIIWCKWNQKPLC